MYGYRAPSTVPAGVPLRPALRVAFTCVVAVMTIFFLGGVGLFVSAVVAARNRELSDALGTGGLLAVVAAVLLAYVQIGLGIAWLYRAWSWLPPEERWSRHWRSWITPGQAAFFLLVPYFHYYWMFVANHGLCDALDRMRVRFPTHAPAPRGLAVGAEVCQFVVPVPVAAILWLLYMRKVEAMMTELAAAPVPR
jgi:hypothetical protein